jgi:hypothetical protein
LLVYLAWFALVGHDPVGSDHPLVAEFSAVRFAVRGLNFAVERVLGLDSLLGPSGIGLVAFVVLCAWIGVRVVRRGAVPALAAGSLLAVCAMYGLIALVRATLVEQDFATVSRYVYVTAFFLALAFADLLPRYGTWPAFRSRAGLALSALFAAGVAVSVVANVDDLATEARAFQFRANVSRAFVALAQDDKGASWMDENVQYRAMPPVGELRDIMNREGSLLEDEFFPGVVEAPGPAAREAALLAIVGDRFALVPASGAGTPAALAVHSKRGVVYMRDGRCLRATFAGDSPVLNVAVDGGARVRLLSSSRVAGHVYLGHDFEPSRPAGLDLVPGVARDVTVPDVGDGRPWLVGLEPGAVPGPVSVCALRAAPGEGPGT